MRRFILGFCLLVWLAELAPLHAEETRLDLSGDPLPAGALARVGSSRLRHGDVLKALAFTPDGRGLLAGAADGSLVLWDANTGRARLRLIESGPAIAAVAVSPDGKWLASSDQDERVLLWDAGSGQRVDCWQSAPAKVLCFLPGGRLLMLGDRVQCRDVGTGRLRPFRAEVDLGVQQAILSPDGRSLALMNRLYRLEVRDLTSGKRRFNVDDFGDFPSQLAFSADGRLLLYVDAKGALVIRDAATGRNLEAPRAEEVCPLLAPDPEERGLILNPDWKEGRLDGRPLFLFRRKGRLECAVLANGYSVALSPDGQTLAVAQENNPIRLWNLKTGKECFPATQFRGTPAASRHQVQASPDGRTLALLDGNGVLTVGNGTTGQVAWQAPDRGAIGCFTFSTDSKEVIAVEQGKEGPSKVTFRDTGSGRILREQPAFPEPVKLLAASPDSRWIAGSAEKGRQVCFWEVSRQRCIRTPGQTAAEVQAGLFAPDGRTFLTVGAAGQFQNWDVASGREVKRWSGHGGHRVVAAAFSADGRLLGSVGEDGLLSLWDPTSGQRLRRIDCGNQKREFVTLSADGRLAAAIGRDGNLTAWETETGQPRFRLPGGRSRASAVCFTCDGQRLVTAHADGTALVWDVKAILDARAAAVVPRRDSQGQDLPAGALARVGSLAFQHREYALEAAIVGDGKRLLLIPKVQSRTGIYCKAEVWDLATGRRRVQFAADAWSHWACSPDGKTAAVILDRNEDLHFFDLTTGECLARIKAGPETVESLAYSPDGRLLAVGDTGESAPSASIRLWDVRQEKFVARLEGHPSEIAQLAFSADGQLLHAYCPRLWLKGSDKPKALGTRHVWDVGQRKRLPQFPVQLPRGGPRIFLVLSPQGRLVVQHNKDEVGEGYWSGHLEVRNPLTDRKRFDLVGGLGKLQFSGDDKVLTVVGALDSEVVVWDTVQGVKRSTLRDPTLVGPYFNLLALSGDGRWLATKNGVSDTLAIRLWDLTTGKEHRPLAGPRGNVRAVAWRSDGRLVLLDQGGSVARLTEDSGKELLRWSERESAIKALTLSANGRLAALVDGAGSVEVRDVASGKEQFRGVLKGYGDRTSQVRFSADGKQVLALGPRGTLGVWSASGKGVPCWQAGADEAGQCLSSEGRLLAVSSRIRETETFVPLVRLVDSLTGKEQCRFVSDPGTSLGSSAFSPDGRLLAIWEYFSDGGRMLLGTEESCIHVVESGTGQEIARLALPGVTEGQLSFSPDGRCLAASHKQWLLVYDLAAGRELGQLTGHTGEILTLSFSPDGRKLATGSADQTVLVWDATWPTLPHRALPEAGRFDAEELWRTLSRPEAEPAWRAVWRLTLAPEQSLPLLRRRLPPAETPDPERLSRLLRELEDDAFAKRDAACKEIARIGEGAVPALRQRLRDTPSADLKRLIEGLLEEIEPRPNAPQYLLAGRAIAVLERIGSAQARQLLQRLADGANGHSQTEMAREALQRLDNRTAEPRGGQPR